MGLIKNNTGLEEIRESVTNIENMSTEVKTNVNEVKTDTEGIVLSNESIKAIVDEIQNRIGLTGDTGGSASAGSVMSKLNQIIGSAGSGGGITGFKYTLLQVNNATKTHKASNSGLFIYYYETYQGYGDVSVTSGKGAMLDLGTGRADDTPYYTGIGFFTSGATIKAYSGIKGFNAKVDIFEFI